MLHNYGEMFNKLSEQHKINYSSVTDLKSKLTQKEDEIKTRKDQITKFIVENELLKEEIKKYKEKIDLHTKEVETLKNEIKNLKKNNPK